MALSRETLISMVKNEYPSSYSSDVEKMSHEDLMGLLDYLDSIKGKADGGAIGIEVLFTDKKANGGRVNFANGGSGNWWDGLTGEAKGIYDSMTAFGASDAEIQSKLQAQNLWSPDGSGSGSGGGGGGANTEQVTGIINQDIGGDGGGIGGLDQTWRTEPGDPKNYRRSDLLGTSDYFPPQGIMETATDFVKEKFFQPQVRGQLGTRLANKPSIPLPAAMASWSMSPFNEASRNYNPLFEDQLNFLEMGAGNLDANMIGRDQGTGLLKYGPDSVLSGKNVISMFGSNNYQAALDKEVERLEGILEKNKNKWDATKIANWKAKFLEPAYLEQQTANQTFAEKQAEIEAAKKAAASRAESARQYDPNVHGPNNYGLGSDGKQSYDSGQGFGINATTGGPVSNKTGRGRTDYSKGGLASMFTRRR
jgi:hypothetical protein